MLDAIDRRIVAATQSGMPIAPEPYGVIATMLGIGEEEVIDRCKRLLADGAIRRIGAIPNHYAVGFAANGMSVWDIDDAVVAELGPRIGALDFVTHCYERPRHPPLWPYNMFAMVHGRSRDEVHEKVAHIRDLVGSAARSHDVLFSTRILKKTGLRIAA